MAAVAAVVAVVAAVAVVAVAVEGGMCQVSSQKVAAHRHVSGPQRAEAVEAEAAEAAAAVNLLWPPYESGPRRVAAAAGAVVLP